jgi:hypothetical protein
MLTGHRLRPVPDGPSHRAALREQVLGFLAANERPGSWTYFRAGGPEDPRRPQSFVPDIVLDVGGRIAYVEVRRQGSGPLPSNRSTGLALARCRGAACFIVRSLPEMERVLRRLGVPLRPRGRMAASAARIAQEPDGGVP